MITSSALPATNLAFVILFIFALSIASSIACFTTSTPKTTKQLKAEVVTKAAVAEVFEGKVQKEHKKVGKTFYLIFSLIFFKK